MKNKKVLMNVLVALICLMIVGGCCVTYYFLTEADEKIKESTDYNINNTPIFSEDNYPIVDGSTATAPLAEAFQGNFTGVENVEVNHSKTHNAYVNLIDGNSDLILVVEPSEDDKEYAEEKGVELQYDKVVNEGFVFFVNKDNPVDSLTLEEIQKIYTGEITNWKEVGGNDEEIIAYQRPENSGSQNGMLSLVMNGLKMKEATTETIAESMFDIIDVVSDYDNGTAAIGYSYYYYANTMYVKDDVKMIKVNGVEPNNNTIKSEEYPIITAYYIVTRKDEEAGSPALKLRDAMLSIRGQKVAEKAGYVPVK
jgi:phosphate transport system substrate-binding protein